MPPKRKPVKPEINENTSEIPAAKGVEESTRSLRPRKPQGPTKIETTPKTGKKEKSTEKVKQDKKKKSKQSVNEKASGEPASKKIKASEIEEAENGADEELINAKSIYGFTVKDIKGQLVSLEKYKGHVSVIVNVASKCGHTASNYKEFVEIYDKYSKDKGLRILAFPCNQFGKQEPGDNDKICEFAQKRNVKFDMFEKIEVNGKNADPLWKYLTSQKAGPKGLKIDWNFTKFLINKEGQVIERFKPSVKPSALVQELEKLW